MHKTLIGEAILETATIGKWTELNLEDVFVTPYVNRCFIYPAEDEITFSCTSADRLWTRQTFYSTKQSIADFLTTEINEAYEDFILEYCSHITVNNPAVYLNKAAGQRDGNIPVIRLSQLEAAYDRAVKVRKLFISVGLMEEEKAN